MRAAVACRGVQLGGWKIGEAGDRERDNTFTARIHDPPIGGGRTVKVVMKQWARLHSDGTFSVDIHNVRGPPPCTWAALRAADTPPYKLYPRCLIHL